MCYLDRLTSKIASILNQLSGMEDELVGADPKQLGFEKEQLKPVSNLTNNTLALQGLFFKLVLLNDRVPNASIHYPQLASCPPHAP